MNNRITTALPARITANQSTYSVFANVFYDIDPEVTAVQPFMGVGAGTLWTHFALPAGVSSNGNMFRLGGAGTNFAYQK